MMMGIMPIDQSKSRIGLFEVTACSRGRSQMVDVLRFRVIQSILAAALLSCGVPALAGAVQHYEYVFPDQAIYVYDEDNDLALVKQISLPQVRGTRGVAVSPADAMLYISYGGDGGFTGNGSVLKYDLANNVVIWTKGYATGIDSMAISPDGRRLYMPIGELTRDGMVRRVVRLIFGDLAGLEKDRWTVIDT